GTSRSSFTTCPGWPRTRRHGCWAETMMTTTRAVVFALLCSAVPARALVPGGGSARSDCYVEWQVTGPDVVANRGKTGIDCQDGDPARDVDGAQNGSCTLGVSICAFQANVPRCTPQEVTSVKLSKGALRAGVQL